jgi:hypothetical protein
VLIRLLIALLVALPASAVPAFEPFFDDNPATRYAPEAPVLTPLDRDVLALCGGWGARVEARGFEMMLLKPEHRESLERMRDALENRLYGRADTPEEFVRQLRRAWFEQNGFKHIFCGEPGQGDDLGGLHYAPRYRQAQDEGWAGYRPLARNPESRPVAKCREPYIRERVDPPVFNISIAFVIPDSAAAGVKCQGGYHLEMDAERLLIAVTAAFKQANRRVGPDDIAGCLFETAVEGVEPHYSQFVIKRRAIRTFYPLAEKRPYCRRDRRDPRACLCSRL